VLCRRCDQLKQTYTLGRMQQQLLAPFKVFLADYPTLDENDTRLVRGDEPLVLCCTQARSTAKVIHSL
jgi:hypothetical protein